MRPSLASLAPAKTVLSLPLRPAPSADPGGAALFVLLSRAPALSPVKGPESPQTERTKNMKTEQVKQVTDKALEQLITALEQGQSATLTRYLGAMARFHRYSFNNVMLIYTQREDASHVAGFHAWRKLNRFVRKGEKGILILAPMIFKHGEAEAAKTDEEKTIL